MEGADREWVSDVSGLAGACGDVIDDRALSANAAHARAGVLALVAYTGLVRRTIRAEDALRLTAFVGITVVIVDADTGARVVPLLTDRVGSARRRFAGINRLLCRKRKEKKKKRLIRWGKKSQVGRQIRTCVNIPR